MTREESLQVVEMILSHWHSNKEWTKEEIDVYARMVQDMDAELTMSALIRAAKEIAYRPSIAELRERVRVEKRRLTPIVSAPEVKTTPLPLWVRRWVCARYLFARFGKDQDMRRMPEQGDWGDQTQPLMPEGTWVEEAERLSEHEAWKVIGGRTRP